MHQLALLLTCLLAPPALADVLTVAVDGTKDHTSIQAAVDAAQPNDTVIVWGHGHAGFTIDGKPVNVSHRLATTTLSGPIVVRNLPAGSETYIAGFTASSSADEFLILLENDAGTLWLRHCESRPSSQSLTHPAAVRIADCADIVIVSGQFDATLSTGAGEGAAGLWITNSRATLYSVNLDGGAGADAGPGLTGARGGAGLRAAASDIVVGHALLSGGPGGDSFQTFCGPGSGGAGLWTEGIGTEVSTVEVVLAGGNPGAQGGCSPAAAGPVHLDDGTATVVVSWPGAVGITGAPINITEGKPLLLGFSTPYSNQIGFAVVGFSMLTTDTPSLFGRLVLGPIASVIYLDPNLISFALPMVVPTLPPGFDIARIYLQPLFLDVTTGAASLGQPTVLQILSTSQS